mgnify:FL=1
MTQKILVIPDTQVKAGVPINHIEAAGKYLVKHRPDTVVVLGDWWDCPSLSMFNSNVEAEGLRLKEDIAAGNEAMSAFMKPLLDLQVKQLNDKKKVYRPRLIYTIGNHDPQVRIPRLIESHPILQGFLQSDTTKLLEGYGFEVIPFLEVIKVAGIRFAHYFVNPHSAKKAPLGGAIDTMLKNAGFSFIQGHTQGLKMGKHYLGDGTRRLGIVAGSFYQHKEKYMGVQGNEHWHGIIQLNEAKDGGADVTEISLNYLLKRYAA